MASALGSADPASEPLAHDETSQAESGHLQVPSLSYSSQNGSKLSKRLSVASIGDEEFHTPLVTPQSRRDSISSCRLPSPHSCDRASSSFSLTNLESSAWDEELRTSLKLSNEKVVPEIAIDPPELPRKSQQHKASSHTLPGTHKHTSDSYDEVVSTSDYTSSGKQLKSNDIKESTEYLSGQAYASIEPKIVHTLRHTSGALRPDNHHDIQNESRSVFESTQEFDIEDLSPDKNIRISPHIEKVIREATQQLFSIHVKDVDGRSSTSPAPNSEPTSNSRDHSRRPSASQESDEWDDPGFCCPISKSPSNTTVRTIAHCYACAMTYCTKCWERQPLHKRNRPGHEKADAAVAKMIEATLEINITDEQQARLHLLDESASWFGAIRDHDEVVFRDLGRYASLMAEHSLEHRKQSYPALIAFVGDTGAGKSSLIKLLVGIKTSRTARGEEFSGRARQGSLSVMYDILR